MESGEAQDQARTSPSWVPGVSGEYSLSTEAFILFRLGGVVLKCHRLVISPTDRDVGGGGLWGNEIYRALSSRMSFLSGWPLLAASRKAVKPGEPIRASGMGLTDLTVPSR